ncbi:MAG: hypothetical protein EBT59_14280 [Betaproteobacteria bacterium]|nr:hypothetical protein [Betaproteobacteria bacterium]
MPLLTSLKDLGYNGRLRCWSSHGRQEKFFFFVDSGEKSGIECKASLIVASFFCLVQPPVGYWADKNGFFNKLQPISMGV